MIKIVISIIILIESGGNRLAFNDKSKAIGLMQITPICLKDYNQYHKEKFTQDQMYNEIPNVMVGEWYINKRIPQLLRHYDIKDSINNRLIAYNWGIRNLINYEKGEAKLPKKTKNYIKKYHKILERRNRK